ncbi:hypothetical protein HPB49_004319 [Dermacentor silvarum]|uniref:Uncharacterized protein n=1 Tax=Dermacentor silvarum TaxID=543639 RepID=A0ACB8D2M9_DERSI|nr:hypothetical protein HPB49_004319 [Dermacentor silvarum]
MSVPTHAYVRYHDGASAHVAVELIHEFSPQSVSDVAKNKLVYWAEPGEESEDHYPADVVVLDVSKEDLITSMAKKRIAVPPTEFDCPPSQATSVVDLEHPSLEDDLLQDVAPTAPPVASTTLPQVHIGYGIVVPSNKWAALMCVPRDSLFCKEGARVLWTAADLKERSVKGRVCRRSAVWPSVKTKMRTGAGALGPRARKRKQK